MTPPHLIIDRVSMAPAFGVRFWDTSLGAPVRSGLDVVIYPRFDDTMRSRVRPSSSGAYVSRTLPWTPNISTLYRVEVTDPAGYYLPAKFEVSLPAPSAVRLSCSPADPFVPLFSAPARTVPSGMAVLRADLWDRINEAPAAGALVEVTLPSTPAARGVADQKGRVSVIFGYPEPIRILGQSPGMGSGIGMDRQSWSVTIRVFYRPGSQGVWPRDLCEVLQQGMAKAWLTSAASTELTQASLRYGRDLSPGTFDAATAQPLSRLLVTPAS